MHEYNSCIIEEFLVKQNGIQIIGCRYFLYGGTLDGTTGERKDLLSCFYLSLQQTKRKLTPQRHHWHSPEG